MTDKILEFYKEYKIFLDLENVTMPDIVPVLKDNNIINDFAHIDLNDANLKTVPLYYTSKLFNYADRFQKSKFFHEFTNVLDFVTFFHDYDLENLNAILNIYSEYHASQIELACNVGFRNIHSIYKINLDKTYIETDTGRVKIETDYINQMANASNILDQQKDFYINLPCNEYYYKYKIFELNTMYYLGKYNFCDRISDKQIVDMTQQQYGDFYKCIFDINQSIKNKEFKKMLPLKKSLFKKFYERYPNNDFEELIAAFPGKYF